MKKENLILPLVVGGFWLGFIIAVVWSAITNNIAPMGLFIMALIVVLGALSPFIQKSKQ